MVSCLAIGEQRSLALAAVYFASALPFFLAGTVVSIAISEAIDASTVLISSTSRARPPAASCWFLFSSFSADQIL